MFVLVSALCGLLLAGLTLPLVGAASVSAKATEDSLDDLPVAFDTPAQSQRSTVLDANGDVLAYFYEENRVYAELDQIAPIMRQAMVAIEDHRFYEHGPLDAQGTLRAFIIRLQSSRQCVHLQRSVRSMLLLHSALPSIVDSSNRLGTAVDHHS